MFTFIPEDLIKLLLAILVGGVIGIEREVHSKAAGLRTITLICFGATLFTVLSSRFEEADRVAANIVTGIGFLGAGAILFAEGKVKGLTTASSIWVSAALGMAIGQGQYMLAAVGTVLVVVILAFFARLDRLVDRFGRETRSYEVVCANRPEKLDELDALFQAMRLRIRSRKRMKQNGSLLALWEVDGRTRDHQRMAEKLMADGEIKELRY
ncbi:MAG: MgtC/SapB family protein [Anaerolineales bacterium]